MRVMAASFPELYKADVLQAIETIELPKVSQAIDIFIQARQEGRRIFVCGNGGSASTASHFVCDISKGASFQSDVLQAIETIELPKVSQAIDIFIQARQEGRRIFVCGNGGSASTASHFVCDMLKDASFQRDQRFR